MGVSWGTRDRRWIAHINANGQQRNLGHFTDEMTAAKVYDDAARKAYGKFAILNFPTKAEREFADKWYDLDRASAFFGVKRGVFKRWKRQGKITGGRLVSTNRGRLRLFTLNELEALREEMFGKDKLYKTSQGTYHVPEGFLRREEACARFGVSICIWWRWEREGLITCGKREGGGPKLYRVTDIERLIEEHGFYSPPYPDPDRPGIYRVPLGSHGITRREAIIDAESVSLIQNASCHLANTGEGAFVAASIDGTHTSLRRLIMGVTDRNQQTGHRNGDPLDCRRENLIVRTSRQRTWTTRKRTHVKGKPTSSQYKGVCWEKYTGKWRAAIVAFGRSYSLGRYHNEIDAAEAYDMAARKFFGEHAWLNFPDDEALQIRSEPVQSCDAA